ncbi:MAG: hypothetical protein VX908_04080 [Planctomycetota bacterium]|nr:hypothetical protein [Planctomycetota bacterium]
MKPMPRTRAAGKRPVSRFLLGMNAVLLLLIALVMWSPTVQAQLGLRGHYLLVAGAGESERSDRVWVFDTRGAELITLQWMEPGQGIRSTAHRNIHRDIENILRTR